MTTCYDGELDRPNPTDDVREYDVRQRPTRIQSGVEVPETYSGTY